MSLELRISRRAARDIERIVEWWSLNRPAAPNAVGHDLEVVLDVLLDQPETGSVVQEASSAGVRRFHLDRIRYWVYYRVRMNRLEVLALWHSSRGSGPVV